MITDGYAYALLVLLTSGNPSRISDYVQGSSAAEKSDFTSGHGHVLAFTWERRRRERRLYLLLFDFRYQRFRRFKKVKPCKEAEIAISALRRQSRNVHGSGRHAAGVGSGFLARNAFVRTNRPAIAMMFVPPSVRLSAMDVHRDHTVHVVQIYVYVLDSPMFWAPWH